MKIVLSDVSDACLLVTEIYTAVWRDSRSTSLRDVSPIAMWSINEYFSLFATWTMQYFAMLTVFLSKCQLFIISVIIQCKLSFSLLNLVQGYLLILVWLVNKVISSFHLYVLCGVCFVGFVVTSTNHHKVVRVGWIFWRQGQFNFECFMMMIIMMI